MSEILAATTTTTPRVQKATIDNAVTALLKHKSSVQASSDKLQLLPDDDYLYLNLTLKKIPSNPRTNPFKIPLPHPILDAASQVCLIIDDRPKSPTPPSDQIKKLIKAHDITVSKVIKISKLKTDYKPFEAKKKLCDSYDLFLVDKRVVHLLPKLIGNEFFKKKKLPLGVDLGKKNLKLQVERALSSSLLYLRTGTCCVMKVGKLAMEKDEIAENVYDAINGAVERVPKKWDGVRSLLLKFQDTVALPVYVAMPDIKLKKEEEIEKGGDEAVKSSDNEEVSGKKDGQVGKKKKKGRIHEVHYMDVGEDIVEVEESEVVKAEDNVMDEDLSAKKGNVEKKSKKGKKGKAAKEEVAVEKNEGKKKKEVAVNGEELGVSNVEKKKEKKGKKKNEAGNDVEETKKRKSEVVGEENLMEEDSSERNGGVEKQSKKAKKGKAVKEEVLGVSSLEKKKGKKKNVVVNDVEESKKRKSEVVGEENLLAVEKKTKKAKKGKAVEEEVLDGEENTKAVEKKAKKAKKGKAVEEVEEEVLVVSSVEKKKKKKGEKKNVVGKVEESEVVVEKIAKKGKKGKAVKEEILEVSNVETKKGKKENKDDKKSGEKVSKVKDVKHKKRVSAK